MVIAVYDLRYFSEMMLRYGDSVGNGAASLFLESVGGSRKHDVFLVCISAFSFIQCFDT